MHKFIAVGLLNTRYNNPTLNIKLPVTFKTTLIKIESRLDPMGGTILTTFDNIFTSTKTRVLDI